MKRYMTFAMFFMAVGVHADEMPVYYDYVEDEELRGGKLMIDPSDPVCQAAFGLDEPVTMDPWPVTTVVDNGPVDNRIDLVMLGDGYTSWQLGTYAQHVQNVVSSFFAEEPLAAYATYFNVHRVDVVSNESGVDEPDYGIYRDTALDMTYNCCGIPRLLCVNVSKALAAADSAPDVDQIFALANSSRYGGAGYPGYDLSTLAGNNVYAVEIALHEFGHAFADLADEYEYGGGVTYTGPEPVEPNVSIYNRPAQLIQHRKWYRWMDLPNVDTFEGAYYYRYGVYRPTWNSKMRSLDRPFQEVNTEQFVIHIYQVVSPLDDVPPPSSVPLPSCTTFYVVPLEPTDHALDVQWSLNGEDVPGATGTTFDPDDLSLLPGTYEMGVTVVDNTFRVRDEDARETWMTARRQWDITVESCCLVGGACTVLCAPECTAAGGISLGSSVVCEGDFDGDGIDGECGDECPTNPYKTEPGVCGCLMADTDSDEDGTPDCIDDCPYDPNKIRPGICGCGVSDDLDADGDGAPDCIDQCKGVDDAVFAPECVGALPAVSTWGLIVLALLLLTVAKVRFRASNIT